MLFLKSDIGHTLMSRIDHHIIRQDKELLFNGPDQDRHTACGEIRTADTAVKKRIPAEKDLFIRNVKTAAAPGMPRRMVNNDMKTGTSVTTHVVITSNVDFSNFILCIKKYAI